MKKIMTSMYSAWKVTLQNPPKVRPIQRHCAAEFDGLGSKAGGWWKGEKVVFRGWMWHTYLRPSLWCSPPKGGWNEWLSPSKKSSLKIMSSEKKSLDFFRRLDLVYESFKRWSFLNFTPEKLRSLRLPGWSGSWSKTSGRFQLIDSMALWIILQSFLNQYHSKKTIPLHPKWRRYLSL